jgi:purine-nucleoside phosphorylase
VEAAAEHLADRLPEPVPRIAVVLGSGLGGLAGRFGDAREIPYGEVPGWPASGVEGHAGTLIAGRLGETPALGLAGRAHLYEGHPPVRVAFPPRVLGRLGVEVMVVSNAAGAVNRNFSPGELMLIVDHLDLTWRSPLAGPGRDDEPRWPDMHGCYDADLRRLARRTARELGTGLREGVYAAMLGPSYETPAEIEMLRRLGADAVGMSTVPEVIAARAAGVRCLGLSCLTNYAAGVGPEPLSHDEVLETTSAVAAEFQGLVVELVGRIAASLDADRGGDAPGGAGGGDDDQSTDAPDREEGP